MLFIDDMLKASTSMVKINWLTQSAWIFGDDGSESNKTILGMEVHRGMIDGKVFGYHSWSTWHDTQKIWYK